MVWCGISCNICVNMMLFIFGRIFFFCLCCVIEIVGRVCIVVLGVVSLFRCFVGLVG